MFEHLPVVSEATNYAFWHEMNKFEAGEIAEDMDKRMVVLKIKNRYLASAILSCVDVVAVKFKGYTKEAVRADAAIALLTVLSLIDKELEKSAERM